MQEQLDPMRPYLNLGPAIGCKAGSAWLPAPSPCCCTPRGCPLAWPLSPCLRGQGIPGADRGARCWRLQVMRNWSHDPRAVARNKGNPWCARGCCPCPLSMQHRTRARVFAAFVARQAQRCAAAVLAPGHGCADQTSSLLERGRQGGSVAEHPNACLCPAHPTPASLPPAGFRQW